MSKQKPKEGKIGKGTSRIRGKAIWISFKCNKDDYEASFTIRHSNHHAPKCIHGHIMEKVIE